MNGHGQPGGGPPRNRPGRYGPARGRAPRDAPRHPTTASRRAAGAPAPPARRGRGGQVGDLAELDPGRHPIAAAKLVDQPDHRRVLDRAARSAGRGRPPRARPASRNKPGAEPTSATTARAWPHGRNRAAGTAAHRSNRAQAVPQALESQPAIDEDGSTDRRPLVRSGGGSVPSERQRRVATRPRRPDAGASPALDPGKECREAEDHDQPEATASRPRPPRPGFARAPGRGGPAAGTSTSATWTASQASVNPRSFIGPPSCRICSRMLRSSAESLRCSASGRATAPGSPRKTRWTRSPRSRPETSSYVRTPGRRTAARR